MKRIVATMVGVFVGFTVQADLWTDPETGIEWRYDHVDSGVRLGGAMYVPPGHGWGEYPLAISKATEGPVVIPKMIDRYAVTAIGNSAFKQCSKISAITIPPTVESIGDSAFEGCSGLISVDIPSSVLTIGAAAFYYCTSLSSLTVPSHVMEIGDYAFCGCSSLSSLLIPSGVKSMGSLSLHGCVALDYLEIPASWDMRFLMGNTVEVAPSRVVVPNGIAEICHGAFEGCSSLVSVRMPAGMTNISEYAFGSSCMTVGVRSLHNLI